jgi:signal transduction histidine kinase/DNA-binding response OmpR family regulator
MPFRKYIRVLLVDDDEEDYIITQDLLEDIPNRKYRLEWISNYNPALKAILRGEHDICLVDFRLGSESGLDLIRSAVERGADLPLLLLTGQGDQQIDEAATQAGASDYLVKGELSSSHLERAIRYSLERSRNLREIRVLNQQLEARVRQRTRELEESNQHLEQQIRETQAAQQSMRQSRELYQLIAGYFPKGVVGVLDEHHRFLLVDGKEIDRLTAGQSLKPGDCLLDRFSHVRDELEATLECSLGGQQANLEFSFNGRYCNLIAVPVPARPHQGGMTMVVINDITQERETEQEMRGALEKERELNELKSRFVSMASHEFRTPLSTILSSASLLARYPQISENERIQRHVNRIKSSVNQLNDILEDFLSLSRLEEGAVETKPQPFQPRELVENLLDELRMHTKPDQSIRFDYQGRDEEAVTDPRLLRNILTNLLSNAIKYSPEGSEVVFRGRHTAEALYFEVADRGIGIPEGELDYLFTRFFRASNATNIQGTGLGLNIVKRYIDLLQGTIDYRTALDEGTVFYLHIPVKSVPHEEDIAH